MATRLHNKPWRWTSQRKGLRVLLKAEGYAYTLTFVQGIALEAASHQGWRASELAMALAHNKIEIQSVAVRCGVAVPWSDLIEQSVLK